MKPFDYTTFLDCGAPSLYNKLSRKVEKKGVMGSSFRHRKLDDYSYVETAEYEKYRDDLIAFIHKHKEQLTVYSNLDVINNPELTLINQGIFEEAGLSPIPVYHLSANPNDMRYLDEYIEKYDYIAIGGLVPNPTRHLIPILDRLFAEKLCDKDGFPKVKLHGFASTSFTLIKRYPWYSVDSATCRKLANFGSINWIDPQGKMVTYDFSSRESNRAKQNKTGLLDRAEEPSVYLKAPQQVLARIAQEAELRNTSIQQLQDNTIQRVIWNHLTFLGGINKYIPRWPWSFSTRESREGDTTPLRFYLAGAFSKPDYNRFWSHLDEMGIDTELKHRLVSFFYRAEAEHNIQITK